MNEIDEIHYSWGVFVFLSDFVTGTYKDLGSCEAVVLTFNVLF